MLSYEEGLEFDPWNLRLGFDFMFDLEGDLREPLPEGPGGQSGGLHTRRGGL